QLLAAAPDDFFVLHQVALLNLAVGNYDEAITQFTKVLTDSPSAHVDLLYLARALELNGRKTEAAGAIRAYRKDHPDEKLANIFTMVERSVPAPEEAPPVVPQKKEKPQEVPSAGF
ncbi:MAG TPA: tetratricopeptide repeat protein, partial [Chroococcales cyanobacterium]